MLAWNTLGVNTVVSLLEPDETVELDLANEGGIAQNYKIEFVSFPIPDRGVPSSRAKTIELLERLKHQLESGKSIAIHCRQGVGRAGMIAASLLTLLGLDADQAIDAVSAARGVPVPETEPQRQWVAISSPAAFRR